MTMPPLAVPSSLARKMPETWTALRNSSAWRMAFLAGGGVEDEDDFVGGTGNAFFDDAADLGEFAHQVVLGVEAAGGVDDEDVDVAGDGGVAGVEGDGGGVGALGVFDDLDVDALGPDGELFDGGGAEGVAGGDHDGLTLGFEITSELGDGGGFAGPVDSGDEDDGGAGGCEVEFAGFGGPVGFHFRLEEVEDFVAGGDLVFFPGGVEVGHDFVGGFDAEVGGDEALFEFIEQGLVEFASAEQGAQAADEDIAGFGEAGLEFVDGGLVAPETASVVLVRAFLRKSKAMGTPGGTGVARWGL